MIQTVLFFLHPRQTLGIVLWCLTCLKVTVSQISSWLHQVATNFKKFLQDSPRIKSWISFSLRSLSSSIWWSMLLLRAWAWRLLLFMAPFIHPADYTAKPKKKPSNNILWSPGNSPWTLACQWGNVLINQALAFYWLICSFLSPGSISWTSRRWWFGLLGFGVVLVETSAMHPSKSWQIARNWSM